MTLIINHYCPSLIDRSGQYQQFKNSRPMKVQPFLLQCFTKLQLWICRNQQSPSPLIYFSILIYSHLAGQSTSLANTYLLSFLPLVLALCFRYNLMFMTAAFVRLPNFYLSAAVCLLTLVLACNDKYKTYIFIFALGDAIARDPGFKAAYLAVAGGLFCFQIYKHFVFSTLLDNRYYFTGFFSTAVYGAIEFLDMNLQIGINPILKALLVIMSATYAFRLMSQRMYQVEKTDIRHIKDSRILAFYLQEMAEEVRTDYVRLSKVSSHRRECKNPRCFCNSEENLKKEGFYLRQMYEDAVAAFPHSSDPLLFENYVKFLLQNEQVLKALYFLKKWSHSLSYYHWIAKLRCLSQIRRMLFNLDSSSLYQKQFQYALEYDSLLLKLTMQIYEVLELKLGFWHEAARETPLMLKLQEQGLRIVDSMYNLNIFYTSAIKKYEKKLYSFDATILYAMYLLSTTNFKDYAELIIKNTSKMLEEVQIQQNNSSQTYAIRTVINREGMYYIKDSSEELKGLSLQGRKQGVPVFKLIIDNASTSFCKLVKIAKEELLGEELNQLVPDGYRQIHALQLSHILNFEALEVADLVSSKELHKAARLPMKVGKNELVMACISIKVMMDLQQGTSFVSVVKKANDRVVTALVNIEGVASEKQEGFNEQVLQHSEFRKYLDIIKERWEAEGVIKEERFNMMISAMNFCIAINSPLASHFSAPISPPLHVEILNESTTRNRGQHATTHDKLVKEIRHMEIAINHDTESTSSSKNSTSAINILSTFSEKNTVPLYRRIIFGFLFVITCCLVASVVSYEFSNLAWDTTNKTNNPLNDTINYLKIQHLTPNILGNLWDTQEYLANTKLNATQIAIYFTANSTRPSYLKSIDTIFKRKFVQFQTTFYACLRFPSDILTSQFNSIFATTLSVTNYSVTPSAIASPQQNMTYQSLLMNYLADFNIMSRGIYGNNILLSYTYGWPVINIQNVGPLDKVVNQSISDSLDMNLSLAIAMGVLIALLVLPMSYFLRSRLPMHEKIFDLFASIDSEMIIKEIKSLAYISNIIKNYGESSEVLKSNVLDYQENAIYPKRANGSRRSSVNNEIVVGLEKFDLTSDVGEEAGMLSTGRQGNFKKLTKRKSHIANFGDVQQYVGMKRALEKRKRAGDLDFTGSQSDPNKRINPRHLVIYIMTIIFILFLVLQTSSTRTYAASLLQKKNSIVKIFNDYTSVQLNFLLAKLYLRSGQASVNSVGFPLSYLQTAVQGIPVYDYTNFYGYDTVYPNCTTVKKNVTIAQTVCMYNYSYLTLMGEFGAIIKELFQARYTADLNYKTYLANNQTNLYNQILANISAKVFYMQSIDNQLEGLVYNIVDFVYQQIMDMSVDVYLYKLGVLVASVTWWAVTFLVGLGMLLAMKQQYFKEVYMLTFLNSEMILNNKRVESFLDSINKATTS